MKHLSYDEVIELQKQVELTKLAEELYDKFVNTISLPLNNLCGHSNFDLTTSELLAWRSTIEFVHGDGTAMYYAYTADSDDVEEIITFEISKQGIFNNLNNNRFKNVTIEYIQKEIEAYEWSVREKYLQHQTPTNVTNERTRNDFSIEETEILINLVSDSIMNKFRIGDRVRVETLQIIKDKLNELIFI